MEYLFLYDGIVTVLTIINPINNNYSIDSYKLYSAN